MIEGAVDVALTLGCEGRLAGSGRGSRPNHGADQHHAERGGDVVPSMFDLPFPQQHSRSAKHAGTNVSRKAAADLLPAPATPEAPEISDCTNPWNINPVKCGSMWITRRWPVTRWVAAALLAAAQDNRFDAAVNVEALLALLSTGGPPSSPSYRGREPAAPMGTSATRMRSGMCWPPPPNPTTDSLSLARHTAGSPTHRCISRLYLRYSAR